ncbi:hypothetical protein T08_13724 [Trichinella sp. T8]|nr:hypothetical protein T08_13724 [Trichinella sp. T8]
MGRARRITTPIHHTNCYPTLTSLFLPPFDIQKGERDTQVQFRGRGHTCSAPSRCPRSPIPSNPEDIERRHSETEGMPVQRTRTELMRSEEEYGSGCWTSWLEVARSVFVFVSSSTLVSDCLIKYISIVCCFVVAMPSVKRETERKVNEPVDTGPSPNSDERVNNPTEGANEPTRESGSLHLCSRRRPTTNNCCASQDKEDEEEEQSYRKLTGT